MDGSASIGLEQALLGHSLGFAPMASPTQVYVALCLAAQPPSETVRGLEASGGGYVRTPATFALISGPSNIAANTTSIEFQQATSSWGVIGSFELWDAATGGNRLYWGQLVDPADFTTPLTITVSAGDIVRFSAGTLGVQAATGSGGTASIGAYLPLAGGTLTGPVYLAGDPTDLLQAATKQYVDAHSGSGGGPGFLPLSGGTMLGPLTLTANAPIKGPTNGSVSIQPGSNTNIAQFLDSANGAASNYLRFQNAATGAGPTIRAIGVDANAPINYVSNGTGLHVFNTQVNAPSAKVQQTITLSGSAQGLTQYGYYGNVTITGTIAGAVSGNYLGLTDSADASGAPDGALRGFRANHNLLAGFKGGRYGAEFDLSVSGTSANTTPGAKQYAGGFFNVSANVNDGGVALTNGANAGGLTALNPFATLSSGATFWSYITGTEIDIVVAAGASVYNKTGLVIVQQNNDAVQGTAEDRAIGISSQLGASVRWRAALSLGGIGGDWPLDATNGRIITLSPRLFTASPGVAFNKPQALHGIDLERIEFSGNAFTSANFKVDGPTGAVRVGAGRISHAAGTLSISAADKYVSTATVVSGGTSNVVGDRLYGTDGYGDSYQVTAIGGGGVVTTVAVLNAGSATGTPVANVTTIGGSGGGQAVVVARTWSTATALSLQPSGGAIGFYGATPVAKQTGVAITAAGIHAALTALGLIAP